MATRNEKILGSITGLGVGVLLTHNWIKNQQNLSKEDTLLYFLKGGLIGGISGFSLACLFGSPNDTVNYSHYYKGKRVYDGITYADRFRVRMAEHKRNGKKFTHVVKDSPKPRVEALRLEKTRIKKFRPINNIQHNY